MEATATAGRHYGQVHRCARNVVGAHQHGGHLLDGHLVRKGGEQVRAGLDHVGHLLASRRACPALEPELRRHKREHCKDERARQEHGGGNGNVRNGLARERAIVRLYLGLPRIDHTGEVD